MLAYTTARKKSYKENNAELLLKEQKLIYSGFVDGLFDHDNIHKFWVFSYKHDDKAMDTSNMICPL